MCLVSKVAMFLGEVKLAKKDDQDVRMQQLTLGTPRGLKLLIELVK